MTGQREVVGWIVLDLRAAQGGETPTQKWYPLLAHGKSAFRPEVKIAFSVSPAKTKLDYLSPTASPTRPAIQLPVSAAETLANFAEPLVEKRAVEGGTVNREVSATAAPAVPVPISKPEKEDASKITPPVVVVVQEPPPPINIAKPKFSFSIPFSLTKEGYYQVGNNISSNLDSLDVTLWITIAFAQHLDHLLSEIPSQSLQSLFCFYYSFLGTDITTQPFSNLVDPNFPAERVSIRLKGTRKDLATIFSELGKLVFYFCKETVVFGYADVDFTALVSNLADFEKELKFPLVAEGVFPLFFGGSASNKPPGTKSNASIGVSFAISLTRDDVSLNSVATSAPVAIERNMQHVPTRDAAEPSSTSKSTEAATSVINAANDPIPDKAAASPDTPSQPVQPLLKDGQKVSFSDLMPSAPPYLRDNSDAGFPSPPPNDQAEWHQFRFSIELRSIRGFKLKSANVFLKYSYSPFGTSSPYLSHPVTQFTANEGEILLPHSFCSFEFAMAPKRLETYLESVPLIVEVYHKDPNRKNILIGSCSVDLGQVLLSRPVYPTTAQSDRIQSSDFFSAISSLGPAAEKFSNIGDLRTLLALEDFGVLKELGGLATHEIRREDSKQTAPSSDIHDTLEYQTVLELELWRQNQQELFEAKMKQKETDLENQYAVKLQQSLAENEQTLSTKLVEYSGKISKLQDLSDRLQERESSIQRAERDLALEKANLEREAAAALQSQRDAARRLEESFAHSFSMLKQRVEDAEKKTETAMRERDAFRQRVMELEIKGQAGANAGAATKQGLEEISKLSAQVLSLQSQNERLVSSRHDMKKKYKTLFRLYTTFKMTAEEQLKEIELLKKSKADEAARHRTIRKELESLDKENQEIKSITKAVEELKKAMTPAADLPTSTPAAPLVALDPSTRLNIERLEKEKQSLLDGAYTDKDELILDIDAKIQDLKV